MKNLPYLFFFLLIVVSCKTIKLSTTPSPGISDAIPETHTSKIFVPVELNVSNIAQLVDKNIPKGRIYRKNQGCEKEEYKVEVFRNNPVKVSTASGKLIFTTNLDVKASGKYCAGIWTDNAFCS